MLSLGKFPTQVQYNPLIQNPITTHQYLQFPSKTHLKLSTPLDFHAILAKLQNGFCCNASKPKKKGNFSVKEIDVADEIEDDFDDGFLDLEDDDDDDGEFEGEEEDDDNEEEVFVPLENMKKWLKSRPSGFGEGKVYDTSVEDKLVEELEQSRKAQLANLNKLKNGSVNPNAKKEISKLDKGSTNIQDGFRVRLVNLPKKKNIHRDLQLAFKGTPGLLNIVPVVSGNEKTRDPVCKGIAFVDFKYQDEAQRFVENYSGKSISFGKVQKPITCEMVNSNSPKKSESAKSVEESNHAPRKAVVKVNKEVNAVLEKEPITFEMVNTNSPKKSASAKSVDESNRTPRKAVVKLNKEVDSVLEKDAPLLVSLEETVPIELDGEWEDDGEIDIGEELHVGDDVSAVDSSFSKQKSRVEKSEKKAASKSKKDKSPKTKNILGSANRLKVRDKAMLTGVLSKYGAKATSTAVKEQTR